MVGGRSAFGENPFNVQQPKLAPVEQRRRARHQAFVPAVDEEVGCDVPKLTGEQDGIARHGRQRRDDGKDGFQDFFGAA